MEKLTKEQRNHVYRRALINCNQRFNDKINTWMCSCIEDALRSLNIPIEIMHEGQFIEFNSKRPNSASMFWFPTAEYGYEGSYEKRIEILTQCIEETNP